MSKKVIYFSIVKRRKAKIIAAQATVKNISPNVKAGTICSNELRTRLKPESIEENPVEPPKNIHKNVAKAKKSAAHWAMKIGCDARSAARRRSRI